MSLFIDKYKPNNFDDLEFNQSVAQQLKACASSQEIPHLIIKGPTGCGKKAFSDLFVKQKYKKETLKMKQQKMEIKYSNKPIELLLLYSAYHYHIDPSVHGVYDRLIIQGFIKDLLQTKPICEIPYRIIIIENADRLTNEAQQSLRRTLEKYIESCRFIFLINQNATLIEPLMSRCIQFRLSAPTYEQIQIVLTQICQKENIAYTDHRLKQIAEYSKRNLGEALNLLQRLSTCEPQLLTQEDAIDFDVILEPDLYIKEITDLITTRKQAKTILLCRTKLFDLLVHCLEPLDILKRLFLSLLHYLRHNQYDDKYTYELVQILTKYENTLKFGSKPIYHLEAFIVCVLSMLSMQSHLSDQIKN